MVGEPLHPHGGKHQVNLERSGGDCSGVVASQRIWIDPLTFPNPYRVAGAADWTEKDAQQLRTGLFKN